MEWTTGEVTEKCKESYSLQMESEALTGFMYVCLKQDDTVKIVYNDPNVYELLLLGIDEGGNLEILDQELNYNGQSGELCGLVLDLLDTSKRVPITIYDNRELLLNIQSDGISDVVSVFAENEIEEMKEKYIT